MLTFCVLLNICWQFCNKVWGPPKEELERRAMVEDGNARLLDLLIQKYERKRWYCQPTDDMHIDARKANTSTTASRQIETSVASHSAQAVSSLSKFLASKIYLLQCQYTLILFILVLGLYQLMCSGIRRNASNCCIFRSSTSRIWIVDILDRTIHYELSGHKATFGVRIGHHAC